MEHSGAQYKYILLVTLLYATLVSGSCPDRCKTGEVCNDADNGCSDCKEGWFGRQCEYALECYIGYGYNYYGTANITENGITCQLWSSQTPNTHGWGSLSGFLNHCRNPNPASNDLKPWCYQTSGERSGDCDVSNCDTQCSVPTLYPYGDVIDPPSTGFAVGVTITVITGGCGPGQRGSMTCGNDKKWSSAGCTAIEGWCNTPSYNSPVQIGGPVPVIYYQTDISYTCIYGYEVTGTDKIQCQADKTWGPDPNCQRVQCASPALNTNSAISPVKQPPFKYEDEITIVCSSGYDIIGKTTFKCEGSKQWDGSMPTCKAVECEVNLKDNSYIENAKSKYEYTDTITIKCIDGYTIKGNAQFTCGSDKSWGGDFPMCDPVPCNEPTLPKKTEKASEKGSPYVFKDIITLTCSKGYELKGKNTITCGADQTWGTIPACTAVKCKGPVLEEFIILQGNKTEYEYLDVITIGCDARYKFNGTNTTTCLHTGEWEPIQAQCLGFVREDKKKEEKSSNVGGAVGGAVAAVVAIGVVVFAFIFYRRRRKDKGSKYREDAQFTHPFEKDQKQSKEMRGSSGKVYENAAEADVANVYVNMARREEPEGAVYANATDVDASVSVNIEDLQDYIGAKIANETNFFENEFARLKSGLQRSTNEANKPKNKCKNKYKSIYPSKVIYGREKLRKEKPDDDNRIALPKIQDVPESDFINASPIKGRNGSMKFVAAQGPLKTTIVDFWRMVWEIKCDMIVMLTNVFEEGKHKCEQYWPDEGSIKKGDITIEHQCTDVYAEFAVRQLTISKDGPKRHIHQCHFTAWPDKSVPKYVSSLAQFHRKVLDIPSKTKGPVIVHCSAGIGRTGTFIALDLLAEEAKANGSVNVFSCLTNLREQRVDMVQTKEQYVYLYRVLAEDYECETNTISSSNYTSKLKQLQTINPMTGKPHFHEKYQTLEKNSPVLQQEEFVTGKLPENKNKNRYNNILPVDSHRPHLVEDNDHTGDYINAVYISGYRYKDALLATQMPLPNTVVAFWTLVYQQEIATIVMLNQTIDKSCGVYWPESEGTDRIYGPFHVSFVSEEVTNNHVIRTLTIKKGSIDKSTFVSSARQKICLSTAKVILCQTSIIGIKCMQLYTGYDEDQSRTVKQYRMLGWSDKAWVPTSPSSLFNLIEAVQESQRRKQDTPVIVHCMNGADKTGLFCTAMAIVDRLKEEHGVVVQQIIKQIRSRRPQVIPNMEQFQFCFELVSCYLQTFETYSNFN